MKQLKNIITFFFFITIIYSCKTDKQQPIKQEKESIKNNIEKPEIVNNYQDKIVKKAIKETLKKSNRVNIDSIIKDLFLIKEHSFYKIAIGDALATHKEKLKKDSGDTLNRYILYDKYNKKLATISTDPLKKEIIQAIEINSEKAKTEKNISIGMTFGDLLKKHPEIIVTGSETEKCTYANHGNITYRLDVSYNTSFKIENSKVKRTAKIKSIIIK